jgi:hypothetical protein
VRVHVIASGGRISAATIGDVGTRHVWASVQTVVGLALLLIVPAFLAWGVYVDVSGDEQPVEPRQYIQPVGQSSYVGGCAGGRLGICG